MIVEQFQTQEIDNVYPNQFLVENIKYPIIFIPKQPLQDIYKLFYVNTIVILSRYFVLHVVYSGSSIVLKNTVYSDSWSFRSKCLSLLHAIVPNGCSSCVYQVI
ncbi:hypothetical protein O5D80_007678 [Batrachochytrium dendrobatidis]|nr:hypothetical protein O5D80_007678 [Batrachochytrium dendrobatidis]